MRWLRPVRFSTFVPTNANVQNVQRYSTPTHMSNPVCEANYDTYPAKSRLVLRQVAAVYCPHLSLIAKWCIDYQIPYRRYDFGTGNSLQKINHFT